MGFFWGGGVEGGVEYLVAFFFAHCVPTLLKRTICKVERGGGICTRYLGKK